MSLVSLADGYALAAFTEASSKNRHDVLLARLDSVGHMIWQKVYGSLGTQRASSLAATFDGGLMVAALASCNFGTEACMGWDPWLFKVDVQGQMQWQFVYKGPGNSVPNQLSKTEDGGFLLLSTSNAYGTPGACMMGKTYNMLAMKLNSDGQIEWQKAVGGEGNELASAVFESPDQGIMILGNSSPCSLSDPDAKKDKNSEAQKPSVWLIKLEKEGLPNEPCQEGFLSSSDASPMATDAETHEAYLEERNHSSPYAETKVTEIKLQSSTLAIAIKDLCVSSDCP